MQQPISFIIRKPDIDMIGLSDAIGNGTTELDRKLQSVWYQLVRHNEGLIILSRAEYELVPSYIRDKLKFITNLEMMNLRNSREAFINEHLGYDDFIDVQTRDFASMYRQHPMCAKMLLDTIDKVSNDNGQADFSEVSDKDFFGMIEYYYYELDD
jgi:hypothetical protein